VQSSGSASWACAAASAVLSRSQASRRSGSARSRSRNAAVRRPAARPRPGPARGHRARGRRGSPPVSPVGCPRPAPTPAAPVRSPGRRRRAVAAGAPAGRRSPWPPAPGRRWSRCGRRRRHGHRGPGGQRLAHRLEPVLGHGQPPRVVGEQDRGPARPGGATSFDGQGCGEGVVAVHSSHRRHWGGRCPPHRAGARPGPAGAHPSRLTVTVGPRPSLRRGRRQRPSRGGSERSHRR